MMTMMNLARRCLMSCPALSQQEGFTALMVGAQNGHVPVVQMLLSAGANKDMQNNVGHPQTKPSPHNDQEDDEPCKTPASSCRPPLPFQQQGMNALHFAAWNGQDNCLDLLIKAGARLDLKAAGKTALAWGKTNNHPKCVALLEAANAP